MSNYYKVTLESRVQEVAYIKAEDKNDSYSKAEELENILTDRDGRIWDWNDIEEVGVDELPENVRA